MTREQLEAFKAYALTKEMTDLDYGKSDRTKMTEYTWDKAQFDLQLRIASSPPRTFPG